MLKFAGVPLTILTPELSAWVEANISVDDIFDFERRLYPGTGLSGVGFGGKIRARPVVPNTLYWPTGASNFAVGYFFCTGTQKALITQAVYGGSPTLIPIPPAPTLTVVGTGGTTPYDYAIASFGPTGDSSGPSTIATINANVTLDANNYVNIAWVAIPGAWGYRVLKWNGATFDLLATVGSNLLSFNDQGRPVTPYASPTSYRYTPQPLELSQYDQSGVLKNFVLTNMYLLPPRPLAQIFNAQGDQLYLLTLVDERYFWWEKSTYDMVFQVGATWNDVWTWLQGCLGHAIAVDAIPNTYPPPDRNVVVPYEYLALVLDAVAYILGQKIIRYFDGTVRSANALPEEAAEQVEISTLTPPPDKRAGGQLTIDPLIIPNDMNALVPASVTFVFQTQVLDKVTDNIHVIEVMLNTLGLPEFVNIMGHAGTKVFKARYLALFRNADDSTPTNQATLLAYCQQFATDWYRWRIGQLDAVWHGTPAGVLEGLTDDVEYTYAGDQVSCRVQRGTWMDLTDDLLEGKLGAEGTPGGGSDGTVCCPEQTYAFLTDLTCAANATNPTCHTYTFQDGVLIAIDGDYTAVGATVDVTWVTAIACSPSINVVRKVFHFVDGLLNTYDGGSEQYGRFDHQIFGCDIACRSGALVEFDPFTLTWTTGRLTNVHQDDAITYDNCTDCCDSGGGGGSHAACSTCIIAGFPAPLPDVLHATLSTGISACNCLGTPTITMNFTPSIPGPGFNPSGIPGWWGSTGVSCANSPFEVILIQGSCHVYARCSGANAPWTFAGHVSSFACSPFQIDTAIFDGDPNSLTGAGTCNCFGGVGITVTL